MNYTNLLNLQVTMFLLMIIGVFLRKRNIIEETDKRVLTDLVLGLLWPCNIIMAFRLEFTEQILQDGIQIIVISCILQFACILASKWIYNRYPREKKMILQYGTICSNAGFLGNPVAEGVYGSIGLLYASLFLIPQRIVMWSAGVSFFTDNIDRKTTIKKVATHPCIVAIYIGVFFMLTNSGMPVPVENTMDSLGKCATPFTMILIGTIFAEGNIRSMITKTTLMFSLIRLIIIPALVLLVCIIANVPELLTGLSVLLASMPAGTTTAILATKYKGDEEFATQCVVLTTLFSMFMIPLWCILIGMIL